MNGTKIANLFSQFYDVETVAQIEYFLTQQILLLAELASTLKSGRDVAPLKASWDANAEGLIQVLLKINPLWDETTWQDLMQEQFRLQYEFWVQLSADEYAQGIAIFDLAQDNARRTANVIINGIEQQFHA